MRKIGNSLFYAHKVYGHDASETLSDLVQRPSHNRRRRGATVQDCYDKGYRHGLNGKGGSYQATYREQEKVDSYMAGLEAGKRDRG